MKPLGQTWGGRGQAQVGGRGSGRGGEVGPPAPPPTPRPQRAPFRGSGGGWRAIWGAQDWRSDLGPLFGAREIGRGFFFSLVPAGRSASRAGGGSEGSPSALLPPRHSLSGLEGLQAAAPPTPARLLALLLSLWSCCASLAVRPGECGPRGPGPELSRGLGRLGQSAVGRGVAMSGEATVKLVCSK